MIIRPGTREDIPAAADLIDEFIATSLFEYGIKFDRAHVVKTCESFVGENSLLAVEGDKVVGLIAGIEKKHFLTGERFFEEQMWFVSKAYRRQGILLVQELERQLRARGVDKFIMGYMANSMSEKLHALYEAMGFRFMEAHFIKELK